MAGSTSAARPAPGSARRRAWCAAPCSSSGRDGSQNTVPSTNSMTKNAVPITPSSSHSMQHARHRHVGVAQALHDAVLAVDRVRALQELARRLLAQHVAAARAGEQEGRVRLAGRRLLGRDRPLEARQRAPRGSARARPCRSGRPGARTRSCAILLSSRRLVPRGSSASAQLLSTRIDGSRHPGTSPQASAG